MKQRCPDCREKFRKPLRPAGAIGAAAYMQFCPCCQRELVYGPGIKVRVALIAIITAAYFGGLLTLDNSLLSITLRVVAGALLLWAWLFLPAFTTGPRRYNVATDMADEVTENAAR